MTVVYLAPRFATAIRMPDAINSVVLGDPDAFSAEHSEREPQIVFVKPITVKTSQTNLLITTANGHQANLLLISRGETGAGTKPDIDFMMRYQPAGKFVIEPSISFRSGRANYILGSRPLSRRGRQGSQRQRSHDRRACFDNRARRTCGPTGQAG